MGKLAKLKKKSKVRSYVAKTKSDIDFVDSPPPWVYKKGAGFSSSEMPVTS